MSYRCLRLRTWFRSRFCLGNYDRQTFLHDLTAGITVGLVALPPAMAFAIASGVPPQAGLYCAVIAGFIISAAAAPDDAAGGLPRPFGRGQYLP